MSTSRPTALLLRTAGTNCDQELAHAFALCGADVELVHLNELLADPSPIQCCDILGFPGGFSYGDDIAAGRILAARLRKHLLPQLRAAIDRGVVMIGICNGFQVLVKLGLLPDPHADGQSVTLADNTSGRFTARWVRLVANPESVCVWTRGLGEMELPVAHGEGRFVAPPEVFNAISSSGQVALRYAVDDNPNGSLDHIAGICDPTGRVFGLMPHPERYVDLTQHPAWTRRGDNGEPAGLRMIRAGVEAATVFSAASLPA